MDLIDPDKFGTPFFKQLADCALLIIPSLIIYAIESEASLKALHAVKQLPSVEAEPTNEALTSNKEIITKRRAISRAALRERLEQIAIAVTVVAICSVQQIITGVINDDASEVNIDSYRARFESSTDLFKTFFDPKEEPDWTYWSPKFGLFYREEFYYAVIMPLFSIPVLYRSSQLFTGLKDRVVFRNTTGSCFTTTVVNERLSPRLRFFASTFVLYYAIITSIGALWLRRPLSVLLLCGALIHLFAAYSLPQRSTSVKQFVCVSPLLIIAMAVVSSLSYVQGDPIHLGLSLQIKSWERDWAGLLLSCCFLSAQQSLISLCYRLDYALSCSDGSEMLAGQPNVKGLIPGVVGTRIVYNHSPFGARNVLGEPLSAPVPRFQKVYFYSALGTWISSIFILLALNVMGYLEFRAEHLGIYQLYLSGALMPITLVFVAVCRGEFRMVWKYREEWSLKLCKNARDDTEAKQETETK